MLHGLLDAAVLTNNWYEDDGLDGQLAVERDDDNYMNTFDFSNDSQTPRVMESLQQSKDLLLQQLAAVSRRQSGTCKNTIASLPNLMKTN